MNRLTIPEAHRIVSIERLRLLALCAVARRLGIVERREIQGRLDMAPAGREER